MTSHDTTEVPQAAVIHRVLPEALRVELVANIQSWRDALDVLDATSRQQKGWNLEPTEVFPMSDLSDPDVAWFLARHDGRAVGVIRILFRIPIEHYETYGYSLVKGGLDVNEFVRNNRIAEVGRFSILPRSGGTMLVAAKLMRAAATETVRRGYTHFITDVFEKEPSSPLRFHQRVVGFRVLAAHEQGDLALRGRRMTMLLSLRDAYERLRKKRGWVFRHLAGTGARS